MTRNRIATAVAVAGLAAVTTAVVAPAAFADDVAPTPSDSQSATQTSPQAGQDNMRLVKIDANNDFAKCDVTYGDNKITANCRNITEQVYRTQRPPVTVDLPSHDYTVTMNQTDGNRAASWDEENSGKKATNHGVFPGIMGDQGPITLRGASTGWNGGQTNNAWSVGLWRESSGSRTTPASVTITVDYTPQTDHMKNVSWTNASPSDCQVTNRQDSYMTLTCHHVAFNVAGDNVEFFLPNDQYKVSVSPENGSPQVRLYERDSAYIKRNVAFVNAGDTATMRGSSVSDAHRNGWNLGVESTALTQTALVDIRIDYTA